LRYFYDFNISQRISVVALGRGCGSVFDRVGIIDGELRVIDYWLFYFKHLHNIKTREAWHFFKLE
jgi:hypothetical protein